MEAYQKQWEFLKNKFESGNLGHAYVFSGVDQAAKKIFAKEFVKLIMGGSIARPDLAIEKEQFPDLLVVTSLGSASSIKNEKDMMEIDVAQIRDVNHFLSYKSYYGGHKMVIMENTERMNQEAQSCFLKTLEEPKGNTLIILLAKNSELLLPTIVSRCQTINFFSGENYQAPPQEKKLLAELLPVLSSELAVKFQYAKKANVEGENFTTILEVLQRYFRNMMLASIGVAKAEVTNAYSVEKLKKIIRFIETLRTQAAVTNINAKLALEILLLEL